MQGTAQEQQHGRGLLTKDEVPLMLQEAPRPQLPPSGSSGIKTVSPPECGHRAQASSPTSLLLPHSLAPK